MTNSDFHRSAESAEVRFGFASYNGGKFELIAINIKTGEEVMLEGQLRPDQTIEQIDKVLPTCVYVNGVRETEAYRDTVKKIAAVREKRLAELVEENAQLRADLAKKRPETLPGMIAEVYGELDAEDCAMIDREWARMRGYILPTSGSSTIVPALAQTVVVPEDVEALGRLADSMGFGRTHDMLRRIIAALAAQPPAAPVDPMRVESVGLRGAREQAERDHASMLQHSSADTARVVFPEDDWPQRDLDLADWFNGLNGKPTEDDWASLMQVLGGEPQPTEHNNPEHFDYRPLYAGASAISALFAALAVSEDRLRNVEGLRMGDVVMEFQRIRKTLCTHAEPQPVSETYCWACDMEHQLHEDAQGFHHVIRGESVPCPMTRPLLGGGDHG